MGVQCIYCYIPVNTYKTIYYLHIATSDHWSLSWWVIVQSANQPFLFEILLFSVIFMYFLPQMKQHIKWIEHIPDQNHYIVLNLGYFWDSFEFDQLSINRSFLSLLFIYAAFWSYG
jgi:hypothetical protein